MIAGQALVLTATGAAHVGPATVLGARLAAGTGEAATATLHDGSDDSGPIVLRLAAAAGEADQHAGPPIAVRHGLFVVMTGADALCAVYL